MTAGNTNSTAFETILGGSFAVQLPTMEVEVQCRYLPFTTVMYLISEIATSAQSEIVSARDMLVRELSSVIPKAAESADGWRSVLRDPDSVSRIIGVVSPVLRGIITAVPELTERVLHDVIVEVDLKVVRALPATDGLAVIATVFERMDKALLWEQLDKVFFGLKEMATRAVEDATPTSDEKIQQLKNGEQPSSQDEQGS